MSDPVENDPEFEQYRRDFHAAINDVLGGGVITGDSAKDDATGRAMILVIKERRRQDELKAKGAFKYTCADPEIADTEKFCVLGEEVGEAARAVLALNKLGTVTDYGGESGAEARKHLRKELVQCGAVIVAWLECIEWEMAQPTPTMTKKPGSDFF